MLHVQIDTAANRLVHRDPKAPRPTRFGVASILLVLPLAAFAGDSDAPWRLAKALDSPGWLSFGINYRVRYESLDGPFRANATGSDEILVERLLLNVAVDTGQFHALVELEDSRQQLADSGTPLGTDIVNTFEPLQAYVGVRFNGVLSAADRLDVNAGRMTIDAGSRRLVARNSFRNTINSFQGAQILWRDSGGAQAMAFYTLPLQRRPSDFQSLLDNDSEIDSASNDIRFWGVIGSSPKMVGPATGEVYFYGLHTRDQPGIQVADRDIYTPGVRVFLKPVPHAWDFEVETALQFGTSRFTTSTKDSKDLQQRAGFFHGHVGYTLNRKMSPRFELSYDYASGDRNPNDNENNRFDTLYGARRFDYGPTGIYGPFVRSNISTPGLRLEARPSQRTLGFVGYRAVWLASSRDQLQAAKLQDPTGNSGSYVGSQIEAMLQYNALPGNLTLETGGAYLFHGTFLKEAPHAPQEGDTKYFYLSATAVF
jgi:hypothetical protein